MSQPGLKRVWLVVLLVGAVVLLVPTFLAVGWFALSRRAQARQASVMVASFLADFRPDSFMIDFALGRF